MVSPRIARLWAEYGTAVVGTAEPRLSWIVDGAERWLQRAYELRSDDVPYGVADVSLRVVALNRTTCWAPTAISASDRRLSARQRQ
jgi:hypothetical protein